MSSLRKTGCATIAHLILPETQKPPDEPPAACVA
jgi:hypothetical protein